MTNQEAVRQNLKLKDKFRRWFIPFFIVTLQRLYGLTLRQIDVGREEVDKLKQQNQSWIYAFWHTNVLLSPYLHRGQNLNAMISASKDGEIISQVVYRFGNKAVRGSTSRGGMKALRTLLEKLRNGEPAAMTPDGPRGPAFKLQNGVVIAASRGRAPIIPFHYEAKRQWIAEKSWDKHRIPMPFTTLVVHFGKPIYVPENLDDESFKYYVSYVESKMLENMKACQDYVKNS